MIKAIFILFLIFFCSCSDSNSDKVGHTFANYQRNNNLESNGKIYSTIPTREEVVGSDINSFSGRPLSLPNYRMVTITSNGAIALLKGRNVEWEYFLDSTEYPVTSFAYFDKNIYFLASDTSIYKLNVDGKTTQKLKLEKSKSILFSDPIVVDNTIFISNSEGVIYSLDSSLNVINQVETEGRLERQMSSSGSSIFVVNNFREDYDRLQIYSMELKLQKEYIIDKGELFSYPVLSDSLVIIFKNEIIRNDNFYTTLALDLNGELAWSKQTKMTPQFCSFDSEGNSYISFLTVGMGQSISMILKIDSNGNQLARFNIDHSLISPLIVGSDYLGFLGLKRESLGFYYLTKDNLKMFSYIDLSNYNLVNPYPAITSSNIIKYLSQTSNEIITIDNTLMDSY
ncbi:hypothetical protein OAQ99_00015 [Candidatus Kapabacteria bacterium]|nr:hypothetical protein [Candidatus Kapabacteria bacterium]